MAYMSGLILRVADVDRFVASYWNDFGKQQFLTWVQPVHGLAKVSLLAKTQATQG